MNMLARRHLQETERLSVSGVGESRLEKYGSEFLEVTEDYEHLR